MKGNIANDYQSVPIDEGNIVISDSGPTDVGHRRRYATAILPWIVSGLFACLSLFQFIGVHYVTKTASYEKGWETDFGPVRDSITIEQVRFTGGAQFSETGKYGITAESEVKYVGDPSPEIDQNWEEMTWGRYILMTPDEVRDAFSEDYGDDIEQLWSPRHGGYYAGFSMFHTLHCLNRLRQAFYPDYYLMDDNPDHITHRDHCFEQIRQYIQCAGDLTPVPTVHNHLRDVNYVDSNLKHTCRAFKPIREWLSHRYNGTQAVQPQCPGGTYHSHGKLMCVGHGGN